MTLLSTISPRPTRFAFWILICGALLMLMLDDLYDSSTMLPFISSFGTTSHRCKRDPPSLPVGNRRRPRNAHPVPVLGPPLTPTDKLSTEPSTFSFLTDPPDKSFPEKYLIVSQIRFGRISNARLLVGDMAGLGIVLNRTVILPHLDACGTEGDDGVWDLDALRVPGILSNLGLNIQRLCLARPGDRLYVEPDPANLDITPPPISGFYFGRGGNPWEGWGVPHMHVLDIVPANETRFGKGWNKEDALSAEPARSFFTDGLRADTMDFMTPSFVEQLAAHSGARCIFLEEKFQSFNWAQFRDAYYRVQSSLLPHPAVRTLARVFLARAGLLRVPSGTFGDEEEEEFGDEVNGEAGRIRATGGGYRIAVPFVGIHLRMGDFLEPKYRSFGTLCNTQPQILLDYVEAAVQRVYDAHDKEAAMATGGSWSGTQGGGAGGGPWRREGRGRRASTFVPSGLPLLIATDSPEQPCVAYLSENYAAGAVILLSDVNPYHDGTCRRALFDQEVLGYSAAFLGDIRSTFSMAIHNIRVLQRGYEVGTTTWLASGMEPVRPV